MESKDIVVMEKKTGLDPNSDTALFSIVNRHAEEMAQKRRIEDYERLKREERERNMRVIQEKKAKIATFFSVLKNITFVFSVAFLLWVFISWVNVISHNTQPGAYDLIWSWNFFKVFFGA